ncbi:TRAP transporter small permease subunit [Salicibibacter cibi]|uniref:TRAP transporter small permease subunit n=1 Tax=Salicibibacter cibi TaxID=2743001 RepID=A0A7T6ZBB8_9BACI|nr:TRAP transporter small permease subunit [Salicibibacter cibi]QQK80308.1 TRAP transporter small permease subunit [Salicibibacter cibi]
MYRFVKFVRSINETMLWVVGIIIALMSVLLFYDVIARYFFNNQTQWGYDLSIWMTGLSVFLAGGYVLLHKGHVRVDFFYENFSERKKSLVDLMTALFIFLVALAFMIVGGERVLHLMELGAVASTGLNIYLWLQWLMVPIGGLLLALQAVVDVINDLYTFFTGNKLWEEDI